LDTFIPFPCLWLSHILVCLFYFGPSWGRSVINKAIAKTEKGHGNAVIERHVCESICEFDTDLLLLGVVKQNFCTCMTSYWKLYS